MVVLVRFVLSCFVDVAALLERRVVGLPFEFGVWWKGEDAFHCFPDFKLVNALFNARWVYLLDLENPSTVVAGPDTQDVLAIPNTQNRTTNFIASICELVANDGKD